jgi:phosphohistidine phosphatase SixA
MKYHHLSSRVIKLFTALVLIVAPWMSAGQESDQKDPVQRLRDKADRENRMLINALHNGGHIIFIRHTKTIWDQKDIEPFDYNDCSRQRNLSEEGKVQARKIGESLRRLDIPIDEVRTSPLCRAVETAALAFKQYTVDSDLARPPKQNEALREYLLKRVPERLAETPPRGTNWVFVGHASGYFEDFSFKSYPEGSIVIFKPDGNGSYTRLGIIKPDELFRLK